MATIDRRTVIVVSNTADALYPANDLYPADDLYPRGDVREVTNIVAGSLKLDEILSESPLMFGQMYSTKFEVQVYLEEDLSDKWIRVYQSDGSRYYDLFEGKIDSCKLDKVGTDRTIVAYDKAYTYGQINVAQWWKTFWENAYSDVTLKQARDSMLSYYGIPYENIELPNDDMVIHKNVDLTSCDLTTMLKMMCEISLCFPHINRMGILEFIMLQTEDIEAKNIDGLYEWMNSDFEDFVTDTITGVQFFDSDSQLKWTVGEADNAYPIQKNIFLYDLVTEELDTLGESMLEYLETLSYTPATIKMIQGSFEYELGDYIATEIGNFYILENSYSGSQFVEQEMKAPGEQKQYEGTPTFDYGELVLNEKIARVNYTVEGLETEFTEKTTGVFANYKDYYVPAPNANASTANAPASTWLTDADKAQHIGEVFCYLERAAGGDIIEHYYRYDKLNNGSYRWNAINTTHGNYSVVSSTFKQTKDEIATEVSRAEYAENTMFANYTGSDVPTTSNTPASSWTSDELKERHVGETYFRNVDPYEYYRWTKTVTGEGTSATVSYSWQKLTLSNNYEVVSSALKQNADAISLEVTNRTQAITQVDTNARGYANSAESSAKTYAKGYYDENIGTAVETASSSAITVADGHIALEVKRAKIAEVTMFANYSGTDTPTTENLPASSWTAQQKEDNIGNTYCKYSYNDSTGECTYQYYRWVKNGSTYSWQTINTTAYYDVASSAIKQTTDAITLEVERATQAEAGIFANYRGNYVPTSSNEPASNWTTTTEKANHVGQTFYKTNEPTKYYRWTATTSGGTTTYSWQEVSTTTSNYEVVSSAIKQTSDSITLEVSNRKESEAQLFANYTGTVVPTASNYPASNWTSQSDRLSHIGEIYYNSQTKKYYRYTKTLEPLNKIKVTFKYETADSRDSVRFWVKTASSTYGYTTDFYGNDIIIRTDTVYLPKPIDNILHCMWRTTSGNTNWYGFEITDITSVTSSNSSIINTSTSLPDYPDTGYEGMYPQTQHYPYDASAIIADYRKNVSSSPFTPTYSFTWEEVSTSNGTYDIVSSTIKQTVDQIELKVSSGEVSSVLSMESGAIYIGTGRLTIDATNFKLDEDGNIEASNAKLNGILESTGTLASCKINNGKISFIKSSTGTEISFIDSDINALDDTGAIRIFNDYGGIQLKGKGTTGIDIGFSSIGDIGLDFGTNGELLINKGARLFGGVNYTGSLRDATVTIVNGIIVDVS